MHGASLLRAAAELLPDAHFYGLTGPRMRAAGAEMLYDFTAHAAMLAGALSVIGPARRALRLVVDSWRAQRPDLVVLLDSPELHLRLARQAKELGLPVCYYIAPQTWASRAGRNRQIARDVDVLACILPFEETYFRQRGIKARFVGHPLFEALRAETVNATAVDALRSGGRPVLALLPGSRRHVIDAMLPRQLEVVRRLRTLGHDVEAAISCVSAEREMEIRAHVQRAGSDATIVVADNASLLTAADLVLVASGTATLHVAHYRKPMVVMYDAGPLLHWPYRIAGRCIIRLPHLSLVNILAGRRVVPEFMPFIRDLDVVARTTAGLLSDAAWRRLMVRQIDEVVAPLEDSSASREVCRLIGLL